MTYQFTIVPDILFGLKQGTQADIVFSHDSVQDILTTFGVGDSQLVKLDHMLSYQLEPAKQKEEIDVNTQTLTPTSQKLVCEYQDN